MAEELEAMWSKLSFTEEEDEGIELDVNSTRAAKEVGKNCVVMKIMAHKSISLDALRKNLRMLWKPNKSMQISEVEEDLFLVEFGDSRDKKKVMDMCPWSYDKQLVLIQDFDGKLTPREIEIKWAPFWVQIYNLPLNCRTKGIGGAIGAKLGEVLEVDVQDSGVQWGRCLRVRVRLDVTKRLVRGKKITIGGEESRYLHETPKAGTGRASDSSSGQWRAGGDLGRRTTASGSPGESVEVGGDFEVGLSRIEQRNLTQTNVKNGVSGRVTESLHENGRVNSLMEKQEGKKMGIGREVSVQPNIQTKNAESTQGDKVDDHVMGEDGKYIVEPGLSMTDGPLSPLCLDAERDPLAMSYDGEKGWTTEKIGPNSRHWKRLAREVPKEKKAEVKNLKVSKREGPTPLSELDPNTLEQKRRKAGKSISLTENVKTQMVGGEAVAAAQHRRAS
nr:hypothetical protein CFP56_43642 [Quercus suber]